MHSPHFHPGELHVQKLAGTQGVAIELSAVLSSTLPPAPVFNQLLAAQNVIWLSTTTPHPDPMQASVWVSPLFGRGSTLASAASNRLIHLQPPNLPDTDVLRHNLAPSFQSASSVPVGVLVIDLEARRRYRTNGMLSLSNRSNGNFTASSKPISLDVHVEEAFPNCPKYIQRRVLDPATAQLPPAPPSIQFESDTRLSPSDVHMLESTDTLFFGTHNPSTGLDANHRGGRPGFVRVLSDSQIYWPDYRGNGLFQSFGNLQQNSRAGVTLLDFETGHLLQLSGTASVQWDKKAYPNIERAAERILSFKVLHVRRSKGPVTNYRWQLLEYSPYNPVVDPNTSSGTGEFPMPVTLVKITKETRDVKTFRFLAPKYISFLPGQYATFEFDELPRVDHSLLPVVRTWTLSEAANSTKGDVTLEISVKRKSGGLMSTWLHFHAKLGMKASLLGIDGEMTPFGNKKLASKLLLISGGIGITPNMAILRGVGARAKGSTSTQPDIVVMHQERYYDGIPFKKELLRRAGASRKRTRLYFLISGETTCELPEEVDNATVVSGRIGTCALQKFVPDLPSRTVYLCGPIGFMEKLKIILLDLGVSPACIVTEEFNF
ncbi:Flavohemoprotein [Gracilariopsis chorda]|uniref:Flavohemoprotein n=1 Tax=Gracilariopsis chorda TaxID=448386 RepID=A0A2V3IUN7_9FLOR|nr:Flavohemoprotein [Gracilariopsis chorda]|eukprot:PXF45832.1 Flavohemoprotein [Gracilariopsis chorda]